MALLTTFVTIADAGSISAAAKRLRLSVPMASRHLRALEEDVGASLMRRTTRRLDLTDAGTELLRRARRILREIDEARASVKPNATASGELVVSAPVSFGLAKLAPIVPALLAAHPRLAVDLRLDDRVVDLLGDGVDLAIRVGVAAPDSPFVLARRLCTYDRVLCASPAFLRKNGSPKRIDDLAALPCAILGSSPSRWSFETLEGAKSVTVEGAFRSNNVLAVREAALAGLGVAQLPGWLVREDLAQKRLARVLPSAVLPAVSVLGVVHVDARRSSALRTVQDFFASALAKALAG